MAAHTKIFFFRIVRNAGVRQRLLLSCRCKTLSLVFHWHSNIKKKKKKREIVHEIRFHSRFLLKMKKKFRVRWRYTKILPAGFTSFRVSIFEKFKLDTYENLTTFKTYNGNIVSISNPELAHFFLYYKVGFKRFSKQQRWSWSPVLKLSSISSNPTSLKSLISSILFLRILALSSTVFKQEHTMRNEVSFPASPFLEVQYISA